MSRALMVSINGVTLHPADFKAVGTRIEFNYAPNNGDSVEFRTITKSGVKVVSHFGTGTQTTFNLPIWPREKFEVVTEGHQQTVPKGYSVIDVDVEIEDWIKDNYPISDWKWGEDEYGIMPGGFGMIRMIVKDSVLTYIATKWS